MLILLNTIFTTNRNFSRGDATHEYGAEKAQPLVLNDSFIPTATLHASELVGLESQGDSHITYANCSSFGLTTIHQFHNIDHTGHLLFVIIHF